MSSPFTENSAAHNEIEDLFGKGNDHSTGQSEKAVGTLGRVVALEREANLHDAPA